MVDESECDPGHTSSPEVLPAHVSYSQLSDWLKCGKSYQLKRVSGLAETPAWWSIGGKGVHAATQVFDFELEELS